MNERKPTSPHAEEDIVSMAEKLQKKGEKRERLIDNTLAEIVSTESSFVARLNALQAIISQASAETFQDLDVIAESDIALLNDVKALSQGIVDVSPFKPLETTAKKDAKIEEMLDHVGPQQLADYLRQLTFFNILYGAVGNVIDGELAKKLYVAYDADPVLQNTKKELSLQSAAVAVPQRVSVLRLFFSDVTTKLAIDNKAKDKANAVLEKIVASGMRANYFMALPEPIGRIYGALNTHVIKSNDRAKISALQDKLIDMLPNRSERLVQLVLGSKDLDSLSIEEKQIYRIATELGLNANMKYEQMLPVIESNPQLQRLVSTVQQNEFDRMVKGLKEIVIGLDAELDPETKHYIGGYLSAYQDKAISQSLTHLAKAQHDLQKLNNTQGVLNPLQFVEKTNLIRRMEKFESKLAFIQNLGSVALAWDVFKADRADVEARSLVEGGMKKELTDAQYIENLKRYGKSHFVGLAKQYAENNLHAHYSAFRTHYALLKESVSRLAAHDADIEKLNEMIAQLSTNDTYKNKYASYDRLLDEMKVKREKLVLERKAVAGKVDELETKITEQFQLALIKASEKNMDEAIKAIDWHVSISQDKENSHGPIQWIHKYQIGMSQNVLVKVKLELLREKRQTLLNEIAQCGNGQSVPRVVMETYKAYLKDLDQKIKVVDAVVGKAPHEIEVFHQELLSSLEQAWQANQHDPEKLIKILSKLCQVMEALGEAQNALVPEKKQRVAIQVAAYQKLFTVVEGAVLTRQAKPGEVCDFRKELERFRRGPISRKAYYKALPKPVRAKLKALNKIVKTRYETKMSLLAKLFKFAKPKENKFAERPLEIHDDEKEGEKRSREKRS